MEHKIIGRVKEIALLRKYEQSGKPEFIAIYGRRRVGKTFLVSQIFQKQIKFSLSGTYQQPRKAQLHNFALEMATRTGQPVVDPKSWSDAFWLLEQYIEKNMVKEHRFIIFIDELPWLDTQKSGFIRAIDYFWNHYASKHPEIMLIVCGSATSWMVNNLINDKGGLHNRVTREIHLYPFTLNEVEKYLKANRFKWTRQMIVQIYMVLGGIPFYLDMLDKDESLPANIDLLFFRKDALLRSEFSRLYNSLFGRGKLYINVISLLNKHPNGLTREMIAESIAVTSGESISNVLNDLVNCDFLTYTPVKNTKSNKYSGIYKLVDFFTIFHFHFLSANPLSENFWQTMMNSPKIKSWQGLAFERICAAHLPQIKAALHIDAIYTETYAWQKRGNTDPGAQIDMVIERADGMTHICEIKYSKGKYTLAKGEAEKISNRVESYLSNTQTKNGIVLTMITSEGLTDNTYSNTIDQQLTIDDLFT